MTRSKTEIVKDILETIKENESCKKTSIVRLANLDWDMAERYLSTLLEEGFVDKKTEEGSRGKESYFLTEKGESLLKTVKKMSKISSIF